MNPYCMHYTLHHPTPDIEPQHVIFVTNHAWGYVRVTYQMGSAESPHDQIVVKLDSNRLLYLNNSQPYDVSLEDARLMWKYITEMLTWKR